MIRPSLPPTDPAPAAAPAAGPVPPPPDLPPPLLATGLQRVIDVASGGNQSRFARLVGANGRTVRRWLAAPPEEVPRHIQVLGLALLALSPKAVQALVRAVEAGSPSTGGHRRAPDETTPRAS